MLVWLVEIASAGGRQAQERADAAQAMAEAAVDQAMVAGVTATRSRAEQLPGSADAALAWAGAVMAAVQAGSHGRGALAEAELDALVAAVRGLPDGSPGAAQACAVAAAAVGAAGRTAESAELARPAMDQAPSGTALVAWLATAPPAPEVAPRCTSTLAAARSDIERFDVLTACNGVLGASWAPKADQDWLAAEAARRGQAQAAHTAALQAEASALAVRMAAEAEASRVRQQASAAPAPAPAGPVSVTLKVTCGQKVRLFQGSSPTSGGTYGWESPNTVRSLSMAPGSVLCLCDDRDRVQSCWTASGGPVRLQVGCGGFLQE